MCRILIQNAPPKAGKLIGVDFLNSTAAASGSEGKNMIETGMPLQWIFEPHRFPGRAEINERPLIDVASARGGAHHTHHPLAVHLVAQKKVAALHFLAQITQARCAADPSSIPHAVGLPRARSKVFVERPTPARIDLKNPERHFGNPILRPGFPEPLDAQSTMKNISIDLDHTRLADGGYGLNFLQNAGWNLMVHIGNGNRFLRLRVAAKIEIGNVDVSRSQ